MPAQQLQFVALTSAGQGYEIEFDLHPETRSPQAVSDLLTELLATISRHVGSHAAVSDGDILQALAMATAIRGRMLDARSETVVGLTRSLSDAAWQAVSDARSFTAGRA